MGAEMFRTRGKGQTVEEAFDRVVEQAGWDYGHAGYTGTIAEKHSFVLAQVPVGEDPKQLINLLENYEPTRESDRMGTDPDNPPSEAMKREVRRLYPIYDDKWGPCVAVETEPGTWVFLGWASS